MAAPDSSTLAQIYKPLDPIRDTIRLVSILPGTGDLRVSLEEAEAASEYIALSYVWGDPSPVRNIIVNNKPFEIRNNLHEYLLQAREEALSMPLWIDALCINQHHVEERNQQVQRMGSIYSGARMVFSWLGQGESQVEEFMDIASAIAQELPTDPKSHQSVLAESTARRTCYLALHRHRYRSSEFANRFEGLVNSVIGLPYFTRAWIVQEICLAQRKHVALYGRHKLDWWLLRIIFSITNSWDMCSLVNRAPAHRLTKPGTDQLNKADPLSIVDFLYLHSPAQCSDPRDHVYALQGLWTGTPYTVTVDYSNEPLWVLVDLTRSLFQTIIVPLSYIIAFFEMLELFPWKLVSPTWPRGMGESPNIALSIFKPHQQSWKQLRESRESRAVAGMYQRSATPSYPHIHVCTCEDCVPLKDMDDASVFCDWYLYSHRSDNAHGAPNDLRLHFVRIQSSTTIVYGIAESAWEDDASGLLLILPICLNLAGDLPRVDDKSDKSSVVLSLESLCRLVSQLQPPLAKRGLTRSSYQFSYWGIDSSRHDVLPEPRASSTADGLPRDDRDKYAFCRITRERRRVVQELLSSV